MRIEARIRREERVLQIRKEGSRYRGRIGGREVDAEVIDGGDGLLAVRLGERTFTISCWQDGRNLHLDFGGPVLAVEILDPLRAPEEDADGGDGAGRREIRAAMPGKVVAIKAKEGDVVRQGQGLVVVEAMKMENEIPSPKAGTVVALEVAPGQTVEKGELLFSVE